MSIHAQIEKFQGPLGLLLHLTRREELDIFDINIHQITKQYFDYIKAMKQLNLELAGEFVAMAATLIHIKSRMLLPQYNEDGEEDESHDPRKELVQKLLEYEKFQDVSKQLYERPLLGRDVFSRGVRETFEPVNDEDNIVVDENPLFSLISAYRFAVRNMKKAIHRVGTELQSISERVLEIKARLIAGRTLRFSELITESPGEKYTGQVLITFLSLLELAKLGFVALFQSENFADIHIETKKEIENDAISRVEDYVHNHEDELNMDEVTGEAQLLDTPEEYELEAAEETNETAAPVEGQLQWSANDFEEEIPPEQVGVDAATDDDILAEEARFEAIDRGEGPSSENNEGMV